jgi:hypothetical protein
VANAAKVQTALRLSEEERATIDKLREQVDRAWKTCEEWKTKVGGAAAAGQQRGGAARPR